MIQLRSILEVADNTGARRAATLNIGGSATTSVCFVVEGAERPG